MNAKPTNLPPQLCGLAVIQGPEFAPLTLPAAALILGRALPAWALMWLIAISIFIACKWLTWRRCEIKSAPVWKTCAWFLAWPGLDAASFFGPPSQKNIPRLRSWFAALVKTFLGAFILWGMVRTLPASSGLLAGWCGLVGLVLLLHFGTFHLLALAWQSAGVNVRPLMNAPVKSVSLGEFWGRRWNSAFNQLVHDLLFLPLRRPLGAAGATLLVFLASGLIHELVISVPARAGYGLPTLYFLLQGSGVLLERSALGRALGLRRGFAGWCFTLAFVALPVFWLFHPPFILRVILPFLNVIGAR